jgi:hypothetical protein
MDKVIGGTPRGVESLCSTCRAAHRVIGLNMQTVTYCAALPRSPRVTFPVSECSVYDDQRLPSLDAMRQIAWEVKSRNRGPVGFAPDQERMEIVIEPPQRNEGIGVPDQPGKTSS